MRLEQITAAGRICVFALPIVCRSRLEPGIGDPGGAAAISGGTGGTDPGYNSSTALGEALALEPAALGPKPRSTSKARPQRSRLFADGSADILFGRHEIDPVPFGGGVSDKPIP